MDTQKSCTKCLIFKELDLFPKIKKTDGSHRFGSQCKECIANWKKEHYQKNKIEIAKKCKVYRENNLDILREKSRQYSASHKEEAIERAKKHYQDNKLDKLIYAKKYRNDPDIKIKSASYQKEYRENNAEHLQQYNLEYRIKNKEKHNARIRKRKQEDLFFKLKVNISATISRELKKALSNKKDSSCLKYLPYTMQLLKEHLEKLFEPWMSWDNYGKYNAKTWNDNDDTTKTWNIDHIIPRASLPYASMEDDNFKKCWALDNLRPYSAKQNMLDGVSKIRHDKSIERT